MIGYVTVGSNDLEKSRRFYDALMPTIGASRIMEFGDNFTMYGTGMGKPGFAVCKPHDGNAASAGNGNMATWMEQQGGSFGSGPAATGTYAPNTGGPNQPSHSRPDTRSDSNIAGSTGTTNQSGRDSGSDQATSNQSSTTSTGTSTKGERGGSQSRSSR